MTIIKNTLKSVLALILIIGANACTDLDTPVFNNLTTENFPQTDEQFVSALGATYASLYNFGSHNSFFSLNAVSSDQIMIPQRGPDWFDGGQWIRVHQHNMNPDEQSVNNGWTTLYGGINNCNRVIGLFDDLVASGDVVAEDAAAFQAELKVLRAYFYYWLLDMYGRVPIVTVFGEGGDAPNSSRAEVYSFVEAELAENVPLLSTEVGIGTYGRCQYYMGKALQARLYLNAEVYTGTARWDEAIAACDEVLAGPYSLTSDYFANFASENSGSSENIWVIPYDRANAQGFNWHHMTLHYGSQETFDFEAQPWNGYCALQEFYDSYSDEDLRKGEYGNQAVRGNFIAGPQFASDGVTAVLDGSAEENDPDGEPLVFIPELIQREDRTQPLDFLRQSGVRIGKYEYANGQSPNLDNDFVLFRLADVMLMKAEALWRKGDNSGLAMVNMVRERAGVAPFTELTEDNLLAERGREMFMEGTRRSDLIRFGRFNSGFQFNEGSDPSKQLFPIPTIQLQANPNLSQNEGY